MRGSLPGQGAAEPCPRTGQREGWNSKPNGGYAMLMRLAALAVAFALAAPAFADDNRGLLMVFRTKAKFDDVKEDIANAIAKRGLVVDYTGHIGAMLDR